jgi:hypothetical protein
LNPKVDLPEIKGQHRKFRTLVTSYIGKVGQSKAKEIQCTKFFFKIPTGKKFLAKKNLF